MHTIANIMVALVALLHFAFMALEIFFWETTTGRKIFGTHADFAKASRALAANQGLYNGFLAAGLCWGIYLGDAGNPIKLFFLGCIVIAGIFGAITVHMKILFIQAAPALLALILLYLI